MLLLCTRPVIESRELSKPTYSWKCRRLTNSKQMSEGRERDSAETGARELEKPALDLSIAKAFVAGVILANLGKGLLLGFLVGALGGSYVQQNVTGVPDIAKTWRELKRKWRDTGKK